MVTATVGYKWVGLNRLGVAYLWILQTNFRSFLVLLAVAVSLVATSTIAETGRKAKLLQLFQSGQILARVWNLATGETKTLPD
jgi:hypothetical protein